MKGVQVELGSGVAAISLLFGATALQIFPIDGLGIDGLAAKHLLIFALMGYLFYCVMFENFGRLRASPELQVFVILYLVCIFSLLLNGIILPPGDGYIASLAEFSYLLPVMFALYRLFYMHFELRERFLRSVAIVMYVMIVTFIGYFSAKANIDVIGAFKSFLSGGGTLQYEIFAMTFSYVNSDAGGAARHTMMFLFFLLLVLIRVSRDMEGGASGRTAFTGLELALFVTIVVIGMSRKVVLSVLVFYVLYYFVSSRFIASKAGYAHIKGMAVLIGFGILLIVGIASLDADAQELLQRKYIEQVLNNDRIRQFALSVVEVTGSPGRLVAGAGLGERIAGDTHFPHNVLFYFFHQAGLIGLVTALALYGFLVLLMIRTLSLAFVSKCRDASYMALASLACFLVPFFRMSVGDKGGIALEGALGLTLGLVLLRRAVQASQNRPILVAKIGNEYVPDMRPAKHSLWPET